MDVGPFLPCRGLHLYLRLNSCGIVQGGMCFMLIWIFGECGLGINVNRIGITPWKTTGYSFLWALSVVLPGTHEWQRPGSCPGPASGMVIF